MAGQDLPEFALIMRGYDRQQVDDYVATLRGYVDELTIRLEGQGHGPGTPNPTVDPVAELGDRVTGILREAQAAAAGILKDAEQQAEQVLSRARTGSQDVDALTATARQQAEEVKAASRAEAEALLERARDHAEQQATALLAEAQAESEQMLAQARDQAAATLAEGQRRADELSHSIEELTQRHLQAQAALQSLRDRLSLPDGVSATAP